MKVCMGLKRLCRGGNYNVSSDISEDASECF